jgi:thiol-disulfide isomerase/thioredoxin
MTRLIAGLILLSAFSGFAIAAQKEAEYTGKLDAQLTADRPLATFKCAAATAEEKSKWLPDAAKDDQVFTSTLNWAGRKKQGNKLLLVQPSSQAAYILLDVDEDGKFSPQEKFAFLADAKTQDSDGEMLIQFPMPKSPYKSFPVRLRLNKRDAKQEKEGIRYISQSFNTFATGWAEVQGRKVLVQYQVSTDDGKPSDRTGYLGMDSDGDGKVDMSFVSYESAYARNETVIFRVGERYLSTKSLDAEKGTFVLREHPASDYKRIELRIGAELPDFTFTDFAGKTRKLSEFRGKYLLLDFWGTWCGPCVYEIPNLKKVYEKYQSRGFEILGMDQDEDLDKVKQFLAEKGAAWTQATTASIKELIEQRFRITAFPTTILLDPKGQILSLGRKDQLPLRGEEFMTALEKLLPAGSQ